MGEHSLLLQDGGDHQRARKLLMPAFNGHALKNYQGLVERLAGAEVSRWRPGVTFSALERMNALTLEVILTVVFGVTDEDRLAALRPRVKATVEVSPAVLLGWGVPALTRFGPWKRTVDNAIALDRLIYREIRERRQVPDLAERTDVLSRLITVTDGDDGTADRQADGLADALSDTELRDQLVTLLLAGHETTATALAWALYELGRNSGQLRRARAAAADGEVDWLEAVLKESMRLHPVIPMVVRTLMAPTTVGGFDLPAGTTVGPSIILAHRRAESYPDPERFDPSRFVGRHPAPHTWIPFGGGVRRCIGAGFSLMEGVAVLRAVLSAWEVEAVGTDRPRVRNITSVPHRGARIRVR
jgi:cytochrome P450